MEVELSFGSYDSKNWIFIKCISKNISAIEKILLNAAGLFIQRAFIQKENFWITHIKNHSLVVNTLKHSDIFVKEIPHELLRLFDENNSKDVVDFSKLKSLSSYKKLSAYQKSSVHFMITRFGRAMNASEMGTGKTATAICMSEYYYNLQPQLIICPSSLKQNWKNEYFKFSEKKPNLIKNSKCVYQDDVNIISYSLLSTSNIKIKKQFQVIILDESHYIKNRNSKRFKIISKMTKIAKKVILLSGTPNSKSSELYTQLYILDPTLFGNFFCFKPDRKTHKNYCFACRYCKPTKVFIGHNKYAYKFDGNEKSWELFAVSNNYITRVKKENVLTLPDKYRQLVYFDTISNENKLFFDIEMKELEHLKFQKGIRAADFKLMELVRKTANLKINIVESYVKQILNRNDNKKYLFFAHHKVLLHSIEDQIKNTNKKYIYIDGSTPPEKRQSNVDLFQEDNANVHFAVLSIKAAGTGLNLYKGHVVIFFELLWSEKDMIQAEDRVHRRNLQHEVLVEYVILKYTTDEIILRSLKNKYKNVAKMLDNKIMSLNFVNNV